MAAFAPKDSASTPCGPVGYGDVVGGLLRLLRAVWAFRVAPCGPPSSDCGVAGVRGVPFGGYDRAAVCVSTLSARSGAADESDRGAGVVCVT